NPARRPFRLGEDGVRLPEQRIRHGSRGTVLAFPTRDRRLDPGPARERMTLDARQSRAHRRRFARTIVAAVPPRAAPAEGVTAEAQGGAQPANTVPEAVHQRGGSMHDDPPSTPSD